VAQRSHRRHPVSLWFRARGGLVILAVTVLTLVLLALPVSALAATPSPAGATLAAACFLALVVPVAVGWGCNRGDAQLESVGVRPVRLLDFALAICAVGGTAAVGLTMQQVGVAPTGAVAARAELVYLGLLLFASPLAGWRMATIVPTVYLLAVVVVGRGEDIIHPAPWAWIAAESGNPRSWWLSLTVLVAGIGAYIFTRPRTIASANDE
jgi:hypothetical protein